MKRLFGIAAAAGLLAVSASAQDDNTVPRERAKAEAEALAAKVVTFTRMKLQTVTGAPYSGQAVTETNHNLADGTRIHREARETIYRDSQGRERRESGDMIVIVDPVANVTYSLDTKNMTGVKSRLPMHSGLSGQSAGVSVKDGMVVVTREGKTSTFPMPASGEWVSEDGTIHVRSSGGNAVYVRQGMIRTTKDGKTTTAPQPAEDPSLGFAITARAPGKTQEESLGEQMIEGVKSRGVRRTTTIEAGAIGNDRPLVTVSESWYSDELKMEIMSKSSDPRTGESIFRLTNVSRGEPAASLFQPPTGYHITDRD